MMRLKTIIAVALTRFWQPIGWVTRALGKEVVARCISTPSAGDQTLAVHR